MSSFIGVEVTPNGFTWLEPTTEQPVVLTNACLAVLPAKKNARVCVEVCDPSDQKNAKCVTVLNGNSGATTSKLRMMLNSKIGLRLSGNGVKGAVVHILGNRMSFMQESSDDDSMTEEDAAMQIMSKEIGDLLAEEMDKRADDEKKDDEAPVKKNKKASEEPPKKKKKDSATPSPGSTDKPTKNEKAPAKPEAARAKGAQIKTLKGGVKIQDLLVGSGIPVKKGHNVALTYTLRLENGKVVDRSKKHPFKFRLGIGECVKGFDIGIAGMRVGGERHLIVPSAFGYGSKGAPPNVPPNATLYFDVMVKKAW